MAAMKRLALLLLAVPAAAQIDYDLLLKGGRLIDPKNKINAVRDVAISNGRVAAVAESIPAAKAHKVVDVSGLYVTPGLVDIHVHVYAGTGLRNAYCGDLAVYPDGHTFRSGVTTVVDAGGAGWRNFPDFKDRVIDRSKTRILAMLNIVGRGMAGGTAEQNTADMEPKPTAEMAKRYPGLIVGIKTAHYDGPDWIADERAVEAGNLAGLPVMVDSGPHRPERSLQDLYLKILRPGDIYTHAYRPFDPVLNDEGHVTPYLLEARKRGIIFDVGHGGGSLVFRYAVPAIEQGFIADSISTDLHAGSMNAGMKDMLNVMSKFLNMGLDMEGVIERSTWNPAREIRHEELGQLSPGSAADIAVLRLEHGQFGFVDSFGARLRGTKRLACELTLRDGKVVWDLNGVTRGDWDKLGKYGSLGDARWDGVPGISAGRSAGNRKK
jgi:dihydroorotase